jgi:hypothetical protein
MGMQGGYGGGMGVGVNVGGFGANVQFGGGAPMY